MDAELHILTDRLPCSELPWQTKKKETSLLNTVPPQHQLCFIFVLGHLYALKSMCVYFTSDSF